MSNLAWSVPAGLGGPVGLLRVDGGPVGNGGEIGVAK